MKFSKILLVVLVSFVIGCTTKPKEVKKQPKWTKDQSIEMQKVFAQEEEQEIEDFLKRHSDWKMTKTGTGLRYFIYKKSEYSDTAKAGDIVVVDFDVSLLDGTHCYSSKENGEEQFMVEKTDIESGLHQAMKLMCTDDKGKFILPSALAHRLIGDLDKIPPLMTVVYDIHVKKIIHNEN
jgi:FKBP-type peptidyl-prolyl cis-trans isomerase